MRFEGKVVVVMGGNSGIGRAAAEAFAREGAHVTLTGRNRTTLDETARAIGGDVAAVQADISDIETSRRLMEQVRETQGRIDVLLVNAGTGSFVPIEQVTPRYYDELMGINLRGPFFAVQYALPLLGAGSSVILTSSIGQYKGIPGNSVYAASKAGLRSLARSFGAELVGKGVRVNCVSPGPIDTPLMERGNMTADEVDTTKSMIRGLVPMKRFGTSEEAASVMLFLASAEASFVTGVDLLVDGGMISF